MAADGTPRRNAIIAMPPMVPVLTGDPKKRDELAEKIKSCEPELEWSNDGYIIEIDSAGVSLDEICPVRETVAFLAFRDFSLLRSYIWKFIEATEREEIAMARLKDACVHAMHAIVVRALHPTEGSQSDLVDLSLMRRIVEEAFGKEAFGEEESGQWQWQEPLFIMMSKSIEYGPQHVFNRPPQDVGPLVTPPKYKPRSAAWRYVAQILWSLDQWDGPCAVSSGTTWSLFYYKSDSRPTIDADFESFVQMWQMPSNMSFWLYYLMTTTRGETDSTLDSDVRFLFNLQCRNSMGVGDPSTEPRFMDSAIHAYTMLRRAHEKFESDCANLNRTFSCEHLIDDLGAEYNFSPVISFCMKSWSTVISLAWSYNQRSGTTGSGGISPQRHDDYLWFLRGDMASWLKHKNTCTINDQSEYCNSWYSKLSQIIVPFIQVLEFTQIDKDAQKFGLEDLFSVKGPCIDWDD